MDRVNHRIFLASTLIAVPMVLMMASLSTGDSPGSDLGEVQFAIPQPSGEPATESSAIQQVAGKELSSRKTRPGLFEVLAGSAQTGSTDHRHKNMGKQNSRGLLDGLFGSDKDQTRSKRTSNKNAQTKHASNKHRKQSSHQAKQSHQRSTKPQASVNWDGIPYHAPSKNKSKTARAPVQDPTTYTASNGPTPARAPSTQAKTRIIRGRSSKVTSARPVSARTQPIRHSQDRDTATASIPKPPVDETRTSSPSSKFSATTSSRRSGRRDLTALEASVERKPSQSKRSAGTKMSTNKSSVDEVALVPRVTAKPESTSKPVEANDQVAEKSGKPAESVAETESPTPNTALAAIGTPAAAPEPKSNREISGGEKSDAGETSGSYTIPVNPATTPVPTAGIPNHPFATSTPDSAVAQGSTPASSASHRSGPPASAFKAAPSSNFANSPIGSGVVPPSDIEAQANASQGGASEPAYKTALLPGSGSDPYGTHSGSPSNRLTTNGQPVESGAVASSPQTSETYAAQPRNMTSYGRNVGGVPMHSIPGHQSDSELNPNSFQTSSDNFDRSTYETRNQMRGAASELGMSHRSGAMATTSELPGIRVVTHGPSSIMIRQTSQFEIRVENRGSIDAQGVLVRSTVPDWADLGGQNASVGNVDVRELGSGRQLVWTIDQLPAGASERMFVRLTAARSGNYDLDVDWTLLPQKAVAKVKVHEPRLDLKIEGPDEVVYGQSQTYKVHVLNPGDGTAPNVVFTLSPNSATPQTQRIGDIPPGKEAQFDVELTAQDLGDLKIHGLAMGDLDLRAEDAKTIRVSAAQLEAMLNGPELKYQNSDATYNLQVQNTGSVASEKIMATLRIPTGVEYVSGIENADRQGNMLRWEITTLPPGATRNYHFRCKMTSTGEHTFAFDCKGTAAGNTDVSIATQVESIADLVLSVNDPAAPAPIGSDVTYEIVIRNRGSKEATDVRAVAQFSHGIEPHRIEGQSGEVVTGQVLFDPIGRIGAGQEVRLRVIAQADRGGHHRFRSEVRSGDTVLVAEEATHYMSPKSERVSRHSRDSVGR